MVSKEDAARRRFFEPLRRALPAHWRVEEIAVAHFGTLGLRVAPPEVAAHAEVAALTIVDNRLKDFRAFPGPGIPHYQVHTFDPHGELLSLKVGCQVPSVIATLEAWHQAQLPHQPAPPRPLEPEERAYLQRLATRLRDETVEVVLDFDPAAPGRELSRRGKATLKEALDALDAGELARHLPRGDDGRLVLKAHVLLVELEGEAPAGRALWLAARAPRIRKDGLVARLVVEDFISDNATHRWDAHPWLFAAGARGSLLTDQGGLETGDLGLLAQGKLDALREQHRQGELTAAERVALAVHLLDAGRFIEAYGLFGVALDEPVLRALDGVPLNMHDEHLASRWSGALRRALWEGAPWLLPRVWNDGAAPCYTGRREDCTRLLLLPGQRQQCKAGLSLVRAEDGALALEIDHSGTNTRLPEVRWRRPATLDLHRLGLQALDSDAPRGGARKVALARAPKKKARAADLSPLADALRGRKLWSTARAERMARSRPRADAVDELLAFLDEARGDDQKNAAHVLCGLLDARDGELIMELLGHRLEAVQWAALGVVKRTQYAPARAMVARMAAGRGDNSSSAWLTLRALTGKRGAAAHQELLQSDDPNERLAACNDLIIAWVGGKKCAPQLRRLLDDPDEPLAVAAARALAQHTVSVALAEVEALAARLPKNKKLQRAADDRRNERGPR